MTKDFQSPSPTNHSSVQISCSVNVIVCTPHVHTVLQSALPRQLSSPVIFSSKCVLISLFFQFLSPFFIVCLLVYGENLLISLLVSCLLLLSPSFTLPRFLKTDHTNHIIPSWETTGSLCHCLEVSKLSLKGLDSKYCRLCKPNQRHYVSTYITTKNISISKYKAILSHSLQKKHGELDLAMGCSLSILWPGK